MIKKAAKKSKVKSKSMGSTAIAQHRPVVTRANQDEMFERLLRIKALAESGDGVTFEQIKREFEIGTAQANELIRLVRERLKVDLRVEGSGSERRYVSHSGSALKLDLHEDEVIPALLILRDVTSGAFSPPLRPAFRLGQTIEKHLNDEMRARYKKLQSRVNLRCVSAKHGDVQRFEQVVKAMLDGKTLRIKYRSASAKAAAAAATSAPVDGRVNSAGVRGAIDQTQYQEVEPYGIFFARRAFYAIMRPVDSKPAERVDEFSGLRTFKISRIEDAQDGTKTFRVRAGFTMNKYLEDCWEMVRFPKEPKSTVVIDIDAKFAVAASETEWHPTQRVEIRADGTHRFTFRVRGFNEILCWILSNGGSAKVIKPEGLKQRVRDEIAAMSKNYSDGDQTQPIRKVFK
ncbi:MAG: WYL domain-containing protein [Phycisphaerales bacterium]|nr:WYL domain-containing protein [Phycisphaerales bacterium]